MIPSPDFYQDFFEQIRWADLRQYEATAGISDEEYFKDRGWSFGNIDGIMLHQMAAQDLWLARFQRVVGAKWLGDDTAMQARAILLPTWRRVHERFAAFLADLSPDALSSDLTWKRLPDGTELSAPFWRLLTHACNHSGVHRGQLNSMIKLAGGSPPAVDYSSWYMATGGRK